MRVVGDARRGSSHFCMKRHYASECVRINSKYFLPINFMRVHGRKGFHDTLHSLNGRHGTKKPFEFRILLQNIYICGFDRRICT